MVTSIFTILKYLTRFGAPQGSKGGTKWGKHAHLLTNGHKNLQICTIMLFNMRILMVTSIFTILKYLTRFGAPQYNYITLDKRNYALLFNKRRIIYFEAQTDELLLIYIYISISLLILIFKLWLSFNGSDEWEHFSEFSETSDSSDSDWIWFPNNIYIYSLITTTKILLKWQSSVNFIALLQNLAFWNVTIFYNFVMFVLLILLLKCLDKICSCRFL